MSHDHLTALDDLATFKPQSRFDYLQYQHVRLANLGADDLDGDLTEAVRGSGGVIAVVGTVGAGKSSLIAAVTAELPRDEFEVIRVAVAPASDAFADVADFCRHCLQEIRKHPFGGEAATEAPTERSETKTRSAGAKGEVGLNATPVKATLGAEVQMQVESALTFVDKGGGAAKALERTLDIFATAEPPVLPVLIIEDTDHWAGELSVADRFFDSVVRYLAKAEGMDVVVICSVHPDYAALDGYKAVKDVLAAELRLPALPGPESGFERLIVELANEALDDSIAADDVITPEALSTLGSTYAEDADLRRALNVLYSAAGQAVLDAADQILPGHIQHGMAQHPPPKP